MGMSRSRKITAGESRALGPLRRRYSSAWGPSPAIMMCGAIRLFVTSLITIVGRHSIGTEDSERVHMGIKLEAAGSEPACADSVVARRDYIRLSENDGR